LQHQEDVRGNKDERELVAAAQRGDAAAREAIVQAYQTMVYNLALRLTHDRDAAAVVLQETFLKVFAALPRFRSGSSLQTWIYRIATNEALQRLRSRRGREGRQVPLEAVEAQPGADLHYTARVLAENPLTLLENRELRRKLDESIDALPPQYRLAFVLVDLEGLSMKEAAAASGTRVATLKTNLHRARVALRDRLAAYLEERRRGA
jgi:RNA polymerase sigma-70 factor (ECF subfamily)